MTIITLSPSQQTACDAFRKFLRDPTKKEFLLSGFAGSGKTFLVSYLLELVQDEYKLLKLIHPKAIQTGFHYTATTNKAATILSTMTKHSCAQTIHTALGLQVRNDFKTGRTYLVAKNDPINLNNSVLIIDEASMITRELLEKIQKETRKCNTCKVLYVGDSYQLPPIGETICPIFLDQDNVHFLTDIQRQATNSPIITFSQKYRKILDTPTLPWPEVIADNKSIFFYDKGTAWKAAIGKAYLKTHKPDDIRILGWTNDRIRLYNSWLRKLLGFNGTFSRGEVMLTNNPIIIGNRIRARTDTLQTINEINIEQRNGIYGHRLVIQKYAADDYLTIFQPDCWIETRKLMAKYAKDKMWPEFFQIKNEWADLRPIYSQTVHKSQGSTYKKVFIDISDIAKNNKWYEVARLMYVAITRASHEVHLYGKLQERYTRKDPMKIMEAFTDGTLNPLLLAS